MAQSIWRESGIACSPTLKWMRHPYTILYAPKKDDPKCESSAANEAEKGWS
jgi:hypothetical protein